MLGSGSSPPSREPSRDLVDRPAANPLMHSPAQPHPKRLLLVSYAFPPAGGVGVQRALKFVKYLPEFGWDVTVLAAANPSMPSRDEALCEEIPNTTTVIRAKTLEPQYAAKHAFSGAKTDRSSSLVQTLRARATRMLRSGVNVVFQPDLQLLWLPGAITESYRHILHHSYDAVMVTAPPFSAFIAGIHLAQKLGSPLVLDYRDEWGICNQYWENRQQNQLTQQLQMKLEKSILKRAQLVLATTPSSTESLRELTTASGSKSRVECVYNGFDPDDFALDDDKKSRKDYGNGTSKYRLAYAGTLWNLNRVQPLVEGIRILSERNPTLAEKLEVVVAGRKTAPEEEELRRLESMPCKLVSLPFVDHQEAIRLMKTADGLVLLNSELPNAERIVSGKAFEYIGAEKAIFIVSPRGDMWELLNDCPYAYPCIPSRPETIAQSLEDELRRFEAQTVREPGSWNPLLHSRHARAAQLDELLRETCRRFTGA